MNHIMNRTINRFFSLCTLCSLFFIPLERAHSANYHGELEYSVRTNTRAVRFSGKAQGLAQAVIADGSLSAVSVRFAPETFKTGLSLRDTHLRERILADAPALFESESVCALEGPCLLRGLLTLRGQTRPLEIQARIVSGGESVEAQFSLSLSAQGLEAPSHLGVTVQDEIPLKIKFRRSR
jgi:polyisoprenoid-binding protein YceI